MAEALGPWVFAVKLAWDFCFFLLDSNFVAAFVYVLAAVVAIMALSADADQHGMTAEQQVRYNLGQRDLCRSLPGKFRAKKWKGSAAALRTKEMRFAPPPTFRAPKTIVCPRQ